MADPNTIRAAVCHALAKVLKDAGRAIPAYDDDTTLVEGMGLNSLDLAVLVVALESHLGIDPFRAGARPVRTVGELVAIYEASA